MTRYALLLLLLPAALAAQQPPEPPPQPHQPSGPAWSALRVSKWAALAGTLGAAVYGVTTVRTADDRYERLERACQAAPEVCRRRDAGGAYQDPQLEELYQQVRRQDGRARRALVASQVGAAATVVLFLIDLRHARAPRDIPYQPPRGLEITPRRDGVEVGFRFTPR